MSWSRIEVGVLIEEYQKHPCLYATKNPSYKNKHARVQALNSILEIVQELKPEVTINDIKTKFHALKTTFLNEHRKQEKSRHSGAGEDRLYIPTLWYYQKMYFVLEHSLARASIDSYVETASDNQNDTPDRTENDDFETQEDPGIEEEDNEEEILTAYEVQSDNTLKLLPITPRSLQPSGSSSRCNTPTNKPERKRKNEKSEAFEHVSGAMKVLSEAIQVRNQKKESSQEANSKYSTFANFVASKLAQLSEDVVDEVEEDIIKILFNGIKKSKKM